MQASEALKIYKEMRKIISMSFNPQGNGEDVNEKGPNKLKINNSIIDRK